MKNKMLDRDYYKIAKTAYCTEGDQWDCRDCELIDVFTKKKCNAAECRTFLIKKLVETIEELKNE